MQTTISTFNELVEFIHDHDLNHIQVQKIVSETIGAYFTHSGTKLELLDTLLEWWQRHQDKQEKPIFIKL